MIIIPMAGMSRRFFEAGYNLPKYMLPVGGRSLFAWTVLSFQAHFNQEVLVFVYREVSGTKDFIIKEMLSLGVNPDWYRLIELESPTSGQAETVALGCRALPVLAEEGLTIFNIDTIRLNYLPPSFLLSENVDGFLEVFSGNGNHWSFAEVYPDSNIVSRTAEKKRISPYCSDGLYYFRNSRLFLKAYGEIEKIGLEALEGHERYIAPMYNFLIDWGCDVRVSKVPQSQLYFSGTPSEYLELLSRRTELAQAVTGKP